MEPPMHLMPKAPAQLIEHRMPRLFLASPDQRVQRMLVPAQSHEGVKARP
jgi:hypothetical protein